MGSTLTASSADERWPRTVAMSDRRKAASRDVDPTPVDAERAEGLASGGAAASSSSPLNLTVEEREKKRRLDKVYARRKRERERIEIQVLQSQCRELRTANDALREEQGRLESLLDKANELASSDPPGEKSGSEKAQEQKTAP